MNLAVTVAVGLALYAGSASGQNQVGESVFKGLDNRISDACQEVFTLQGKHTGDVNTFNGKCTEVFISDDEYKECNSLQEIIESTFSNLNEAVEKCKNMIAIIYGEKGRELANSITV